MRLLYDGITFNCQKELRKWEQTGSRRVAWDWDKVLKSYRAHPKRFNYWKTNMERWKTTP